MRPLVLAALVAGLGGFLFGYDTAVINGANQYLRLHFSLDAVGEGFAGASAIIGCIPGALIAGFLSDRYGRRKVLFLCAILYATSALLLICIVAYIGAFSMAMGPIPWIVCSEIFPTRIRGRAMSLATFVIWTGCFAVAQTFPLLNDSPAIGPALTFWVYGGCSLLSFLFIAALVTETKGRTLEQIEASWHKQPENSPA